MAEHVLNLSRRLAAPREKVFAVWENADHRMNWWSRKGLSCAEFTHDFRVGGTWQSRLVGDETGRSFWMGGAYTVIDRPKRIAFTFAWLEGGTERGVESVIEVTLEADGSDTVLGFRQAPFATVEARDAHGEGWSDCIDSLAEMIAAG